MASVMRGLLTRLEVARQKLVKVLEHAEDDDFGAVTAADREFSSILSEILDLELSSNEERAVRIVFILKEIMAASDTDGLGHTMAEKSIEDVQKLLEAK